MRKLLVVDDAELNRLILRELFCTEFDVLEAENGQIALDLIERYQQELSIVLLDAVMPVKDGFDVLQAMNKSGLIQTIPVIMITSENDDEKSLMGYALGISDMVNKPFNSEIIYRRVNNVVDLYAHRQNLELRLQEQRIMLDQQADRLRRSNEFVIDALSTAVEFRNGESGAHIQRMRLLTKALLQRASKDYPFSEEQINMMSSAASMHDIGKIAIADSILLKPGPLTKEEFEIMKTHAKRGCEILTTLDYTQDRQYFKYCYEICRHHHERWDGRGYPDGLKGDEISIWAQAAALADVYDALTSKRVYKEAYSHEQALTMIVNGECGIFNPQLLEYLLETTEDLRTLQKAT